jgi:hypothetical protein
LDVEVTAAPDDEDADCTGAERKRPQGAEPAAASGLREARREDDSVLYVYEVERRIKQAMIVRRGTAIDTEHRLVRRILGALRLGRIAARTRRRTRFQCEDRHPRPSAFRLPEWRRP